MALEATADWQLKFGQEGLAFDDVMLIPAESSVLPGEVSTTTRFTREIVLDIPIVSAAMDTVTEARLAIALALEGGIGVIHRNLSIEDQAAEVRKAKGAGAGSTADPAAYPHAARDTQGRLRVAAAVGVGPDALERCEALLAEGVDALVVDTSHGHSRMVVDTVRRLARELGGRAQLVAGNVATAAATQALIEAGVDAVKVGVGPGCFAAGTRILMADATYKNIEDVQPGDRVINMSGEPVTVLRAWCTGVREVMAVRHTGSFRETLVTPDHRYYVGDLSTVIPATVSNKGYVALLEKTTKRNTSKLVWKEVGAAEHAALLLPRRIAFELPQHIAIDLRDFAVRKDKQLARYETAISDSYELGYVFGTFLGDGHAFIALSRNSILGRVSWYFGHGETEIVSKFTRCLKAVTGAEVRPTLNSRVIKMHFYSLQWARLLSEFGKRHEKHLPSRYLCANPEYLRGLYDGLIDSDSFVGADGRISFRNTSPRLVELFNVLCFLVEGSFPNSQIESPSAGGLNGTANDQCRESYRSRLNVTHLKRHLSDYQVIKKLGSRQLSITVPVYDIEVDCPTHSFIADNAITHNSICTTRVVAGVGVPQITAIFDCARAAAPHNVPVIADGGVHYSGDLAKAIAAGADTVMLGSLLAGVDESPGELITSEGARFKEYRGMGSIAAMQRRSYSKDRYFQAGVIDEKRLIAEGIEARVPYRGSLAQVVFQLVGGLRQGMGYCGAGSIEALKAARFVRTSSAGLRESHPHDVIMTREAPNYRQGS